MTVKDPFGLVGQVIDGHFRVDEVTGEGGFSVVYRGFHVGLGESIAIKCLKLPPALGSALVESFMRRFRDEGKLLYRLSQGNLHIVRSIASGITMGPITGALVPYMVLEWLEGVSLAGDLEARQAAGRTGRTLQETVELLDSALLAVGYAHSQGVVHRDLNPGNIFLTRRPDGVKAKVLDFGVAKVVSDHAMEMGPRAPTFGQIRIFAPGYAAPEQFDTALGPIGAYTDVYTLALVMMEVMTDTEVVRGENLGEFVFQTLNSDRRPTPHGLGIPVGDAVNAVFTKATALHPAERQKDANELYSSLKEAIRKDAKKPHPRPLKGPIDKFHSDDDASPDTLREQRADNFKLTLAGTGDPLGPLLSPPRAPIVAPAPAPAAGRPAVTPSFRPNEYAVPIIDPALLAPPLPVTPPVNAAADFKSTLRMDTSALEDPPAQRPPPRILEEIAPPRQSPQPEWQHPHAPAAGPKPWVVGAIGAGL
ncbi:MAG: serine/threonine-protein kinase, partial [Polyangiaceae bacterium]